MLNIIPIIVSKIRARERNAEPPVVLSQPPDVSAAYSEWHALDLGSIIADPYGSPLEYEVEATNGCVTQVVMGRAIVTPTRAGVSSVTVRGTKTGVGSAEVMYTVTVDPHDAALGLPSMPDPDVYYLVLGDDPLREMTVHWVTSLAISDRSVITIREVGGGTWTAVGGTHVPHPYTGPQAEHPDFDDQLLIHTVKLYDLEPGSEYEFRFTESGPIRRFRTFPEDLSEGNVRIAFTGDIRDIRLEDLCSQVADRDVDALVITGDLAYDDGLGVQITRWLGGEPRAIWPQLVPNLETVSGRIVPIVPGIGNHEVIGGYRDTKEYAPYFYSYFSWPARGYGVIDAGKYLSLIVCDTGHSNPMPGRDYDVQTAWLQSVLQDRKSSGVTHVIPTYHVPAYPSNRSLTTNRSISVRETWTPIFDAVGITLVVEHHDHTYKRTKGIRWQTLDPAGAVYLGDGFMLRPVKNPATTWYLDEAYGSVYLPGEDEDPNNPHPDTGLPASPDKSWHFFLVELRPDGRTVYSISTETAEVFHQFDQSPDAPI